MNASGMLYSCLNHSHPSTTLFKVAHVSKAGFLVSPLSKCIHWLEVLCIDIINSKETNIYPVNHHQLSYWNLQ